MFLWCMNIYLPNGWSTKQNNYINHPLQTSILVVNFLYKNEPSLFYSKQLVIIARAIQSIVWNGFFHKRTEPESSFQRGTISNTCMHACMANNFSPSVVGLEISHRKVGSSPVALYVLYMVHDVFQTIALTYTGLLGWTTIFNYILRKLLR
jgi:hypothetical protein